MVDTPLGSAIQFLTDFGLFDVVLPFLLVFTIIFAILEKTKILGTVKSKEGQELSNKNINTMVSFVIGLLVVASANIVRTINESLPNIVLLVVISISFLILVGTFWSAKEGEDQSFAARHGGWYKAFILIMFVMVIGIFLNSIYVISGGQEYSLLQVALDFIINQWSGTIIGALIVLFVIVGTITMIVRSPKAKKEAE
ncbi:hypothetical protein K8R47_01300 [archaeon]|nr:hypothetical protein [archaeon]